MKVDSKNSQIKKPGVYIKTFGCQMNEYDSQRMFSMLENSHIRVSEPEEAEVIIINTCSVREKAENKLYSHLGRLRDLKEKGTAKVIGVAGCVAQQEGKNIVKRSDLVDFVVGTHNLSLIPSLVNGALGSDSLPQVAIDYREDWEELPKEFDAYNPIYSEGVEHNAFGAYGAPVRALVAISRGCNKNCSFCVVPTTRGKEVSRPIEEILREVKLKTRLGSKEVMLLGQTVNSYGLDLNPRIKFEQLISEVSKIDGVERIRFTSPHPAEVRDAFIELYGQIPQLSPQIHMPLQSGSNRILKLMNRNYKVERYLEIIEKLKSKSPGIAITSDIIVGFPTETDEDFEATLDVMRQVKFSTSFSFIYSPRQNTKAIIEYGKDELVNPEVAKNRLMRLQDLQKEQTLEYHQSFVGKEVEVLIEGRGDNGNLRGRTPENILVEVSQGSSDSNLFKAGILKKFLISSATPHVLKTTISDGI